MQKPQQVLLDASAVLAWLQQEPGSEVVDAVLDQALISTVNAAEVVHKLISKGATADRAWKIFDQICLTTVDFNFEMSRTSSQYSGTKGLSLGDRACLGTASTLGIQVLSSDQRWADLGFPQVRMIRP